MKESNLSKAFTSRGRCHEVTDEVSVKNGFVKVIVIICLVSTLTAKVVIASI